MLFLDAIKRKVGAASMLGVATQYLLYQYIRRITTIICRRNAMQPPKQWPKKEEEANMVPTYFNRIPTTQKSDVSDQSIRDKSARPDIVFRKYDK